MSFLDGNYQLQESQRLEFKEALVGLPDDIWETYSAFANTEGGEIVLGAHQDKESGEISLTGVADAEALIDAFWNDVRNPTKVERDIMLADGVSAVTRDGLSIVVVTVPRAERGDKPVRVYDKRKKQMVAWVRRGAGDKRASEGDLSLMAYDRTSSADRKALDHYGLDALCPETIARYRALFAALKPQSPWVTDSDEDFLYHIGAAARDSKGTVRTTRAGLLAFGYEYEITSYLPQYLLDYREQAAGSDRWSDRVYSMSGDWSGNIIDFYLTVSQKLKNHFKAPFGTDEFGMSHSPRNPITEAANEAVANALIHAYYGDSCTVKVVLTDEKLEVSNPGNLLVDRDVAIAGGVSETRNPTLMRILSFIGASDRAGSGLQNIWRVWKNDLSSTPLLAETHSPAAVRLTLPLGGLPTHASARSAIDADLAELLEFIGTRPNGISSREAAAKTGVSMRVAQKRLKQLFDSGSITRTREGNTWRYRAVTDIPAPDSQK
jgi:predicted HTH transcriptional regulator